MARFLFVLLALVVTASSACAQIDSRPKVHARLISEGTEVAPGGTILVALEEDIRPGWHTYWRNPGDAGEPTEIQWKLPAGWAAGPIQWPYPKELPVGPLMNYGYEGKVWLLAELKAPPNAPAGVADLTAAVSWLVCREVCIPEDTTLTLPLAVTAAPSAPDPAINAQFAAARAKLPGAMPAQAIFSVHRGLHLFVPTQRSGSVSDSLVRNSTAQFFPFDPDVINGISPQVQGSAGDGIVLRLAPGKKAQSARTLTGVIEFRSEDGSVRAFDVHAKPGLVPEANFVETAALTLPLAVLFAFIGGLILNLMPCVLPILAMKALAVASHAGKSRRAAAQEGLAYGAGAILSFAGLGAVVVALRAGGAAVGWGFQLQEPAVVACFALLVFAVSLNLSGVFEVPGIGAGEALAQRGGWLGAFFTGMLAVAVAAPCTAPFMGAALGFALTQSTVVSLLVFVALGSGFAAPFVLLAFWPSLMRLLPKPGVWMVTFRQLLAFPMYATALWLAWVLSVQTAADGLVLVLGAALALGFGLWVLGTTQRTVGWTRTWGWAPLALVLLTIPGLFPLLDGGAKPIVSHALTSGLPEPYTQARLEMLRAQNRPVFVNATAAWCVTCMVNERVALEDSRVRDAFASHHVVYLVADWTRRDADVTALLNAHGRNGVPLYVYYAPGAPDGKILPQILTPGELLTDIGAR